MMYTVIFKNTSMVANVREKLVHLLASIYSFTETYKTFLMKCAIIFMSVKIGIILLATFSAMAFLLGSATPYLAGEMSKAKAIILASPLTMIIMVKLYFIGKTLMTYHRSRSIIITVFNVLVSKGRQSIRHIGEVLPSELLPLSLEKVRNQ